MINTDIDTYVAVSMSSMSKEEYAGYRKIFLEVCDSLDARGMLAYRAPFEDTADSEFDSPADVLDKDLKALESMKHFVPLYTHKAASSSLIELGYAWKIRIHQFSDERDLPKLVYKTLA